MIYRCVHKLCKAKFLRNIHLNVFNVSWNTSILGKMDKCQKDNTTIDDSISRLDDEMMITSYLQIREIVYSNMNFKHNARKGMW